ncbi:hypothetical protein [Dehalobacter sp. TeCB1]|uniref:hypothetical protein n=1 Tax=Dehalobacter sp. TeCB1 TaxID=1843715 RepID=UPI00083A1426|nr:hypothetical protein [Dehalobacter sp. TeCB1]OCZ54290.1 hypothetical protein A7D23_05850 [Dehalobacter sp. TeCB1]
MKIEIGESLVLSWLKHIKECQLVQTNWKASYKWELKNRDTIEQLMKRSNELFSQKYGYDIYKGNRSIDQLIGQAEIDVIGICFEETQNQIYAIDVAFHEAGLNYGSKNETVTRVIKKCLRSAMCIHGYFGIETGTIIFTSPKINPAVEQDLTNCLDDISLVLKDTGLNYKIRIIGNDDFSEKILEPVLNVLGDVADTSELFMRSLQMYNMFAGKKPKQTTTQRTTNMRKVSPEFDVIKSQGIDGLEEMKIGVIVRTVLRKLLEDGMVLKEEIEKMQTKEYSKETFDLQYPLLQKAALTQGKSPVRYYSAPLKIYGEDYFLCSEWFEVPANNDRPYLMKWLALRK